MQDAFYLEIAEGQDGEKILADLQAQGLVEEYSQPFLDIDMSFYRVKFMVSEEQAKRTIAIMNTNKLLKAVESVPRFEIQQSFGYSDKVDPSPPPGRRKQLTSKSVRFTTQQVLKNDFEWQRYTNDIWLEKEVISCVPPSTNPKVKVAIIDNAFVAEHPSFLWSVVKTIDVADQDTNVSPPLQDADWMHGTHSAGLIAGKKVSGKWIVGTSLGSTELYLLKATSDSALPNEITHGVEAFAKAVELDVDVISLSRWAYLDFPIFQKIVKKALDKWIIVIAAAGNYGSADFFYPAAYEKVIAVWSFDKELRRSVFSNYWPWVDIYAPGEELVVPEWKDGFAKTDGTSASAPLFAGVYAFLLHKFWDSSPLEAYYTHTERTLNYLKIHDLCSPQEPELPEDLTLNALTQQFEDTTPIPDETEVIEHPAAPIVQEVPAPTPDKVTQVLAMIDARWPRMLASALVVIFGILWSMKKTVTSWEEKE